MKLEKMRNDLPELFHVDFENVLQVLFPNTIIYEISIHNLYKVHSVHFQIFQNHS
jgi:hypothetical protein